MWQGFQRPQKVEFDTEVSSMENGLFLAQPFERGFGTTVGNALRRVLLSSIEGAAITSVKIEGVLHEFSSMAGVTEDVTDVILNLKKVPLLMHGEEPRVLEIDRQGPCVVTAADLVGDSSVEIVDGSIPIATLNEEGHLRMQVMVSWGRGYRSAEYNFDESMGIGWIPVDAVHSPVRRVNYHVEAARLGQTTDYEKLVIEIQTNGTLVPEDALSQAAELVRDHMTIFIGAERTIVPLTEPEEEEPSELDILLEKSIDDLELSVRSVNCLKNANIHTLRDLVQKSEKEMLSTRNFGRKSLEELQTVLGQLGLSFGMDHSGQMA